MRLAVFKGERSIDELAARLFQLKGGDSQARKQATEALTKANPQLANLDRVPPGSVVVIPDLPHAVNTGEVVQPTTTAAADLARSVAEHVTVFASGLAAGADSAAAQADSTRKLLNDRSLTAAAANDPALKQRLAAIDENTQATLRDVQAKRPLLQQAIAQMQDDLAKFLEPPPIPGPAPSPPPSPPSGGPPSPPPALTPTPQPPPTGGPTGGPPSPRPTPRPVPDRPVRPESAAAPATRKRKTSARQGQRQKKPK